MSESTLTGEGEIGDFVMPGVGLDHWPIFLEWTRLGEFIKRPFLFEKFWMTHPDFQTLVKDWWKGYQDQDGSKMYILQQKLKYIKNSLKKWNESFAHILIEKQRLESQIGEIQSKVIREGYSKEDKTKE